MQVPGRERQADRIKCAQDIKAFTLQPIGCVKCVGAVRMETSHIDSVRKQTQKKTQKRSREKKSAGCSRS